MKKKIYGKELANKFIKPEDYLRNDYFEDAIKERIAIYKQCYSGCVIEVKRNKNGARVIAYEKLN